MKVIRGKTAVVTGAASGIGRAIALALANEGARVMVVDVDDAGAIAAADEIRALGVDSLAHRCDVSEPAQNTAAIALLLERWGVPDILVNNAGLTYYGQTRRMSAEHWDRLLKVNLHAPIQWTRELLPLLLDHGEAHVLNVASICGLVGLARVAAYTTTKFGLVGFSESLRNECGRMGLGVTALCPGFVDTNLFASAPRGADVPESKRPPRWTLGTPEAVARRAVRAIYRNHGVVVMQPTARFLYWTKRLAPGVFDLAHRLRRRSAQPAPESSLVRHAAEQEAA